MKRIYIYFLLVLLPSFGFSQTAPAHIQHEVKAVLDSQQRAWNNGKVEQFMDGYWRSDSLKFITNKGIRYGWQAMLDGYKKGYPDAAAMGVLDFNILRIDLLAKKLVMVTGKWKVTGSKGVQEGAFTLLVQKIGNRWLIVSDHTS
jgi:hypothetical protein